MKPALEELIEENKLIAGFASPQKEFKEIHLKISEFDIELLKANFEDSKKLIETRQNNVVETDEDIVYLEDIISEYKSSNFAELTMATTQANLKVEQLSEALQEYKQGLPRLLSENYKAFKKNLKKKDKVEDNDEEYCKLRTFTKQFAQNFIDYCAIGERYSISPWFAWFKKRKALKNISKISQEEQEELKELKDSFYSNLDKLKISIHSENIEELRKLKRLDFSYLRDCVQKKDKDEYASLYELSRNLIKEYDERKIFEEKQRQNELTRKKEQERQHNLRKLELDIEKEKALAEDKKHQRECLLKQKEIENNLRTIISKEKEENSYFVLTDYLEQVSTPTNEACIIKNIIVGKDKTCRSWDERLVALQNRLKLMGYTQNKGTIEYIGTAQKAIEKSIEHGTLSDLIRKGGIRKSLVLDTMSCLREYVVNSEATINFNGFAVA